MVSAEVVKVYGDSLSMPRPADGIPWGSEYSMLLKGVIESACGVHAMIYNRSMGGARISRLAVQYTEDLTYLGEGQILVIQSGVVDCAPRPLPSPLRVMLGYSPGFIRRPVVRFLHDNRAKILKAGLGTRPTSPASFKMIMKKWLETSSSREKLVCVVNIAPTNDEIENHSPGFGKSIVMYNGIIRALVEEIGSPRIRLIDVHRAIIESRGGTDEFINRKDGHHITAAGHGLYSEMLFGEISKVISDRERI